MAYTGEVLRRARERLAQAKAERESENAEHLRRAYRQVPRLAEIDRALRLTMAQAAQTVFQQGGDPQAEFARIRQENQDLQREREWLIEDNFEEGFLEDAPVCTVCGDSGYVGAQMCECLRELCRQEQKKELAALFGTDSFEKFRLELYSDQYDAKCHSSPRELMRATYRRAQSYAQCFPAEGQSLLFSGATGLGKTYLSACIARVVADRGFSVCYAPVGQLFSAFEDDKFRPRPDISRTEAFFISDLLVLDDLGTEMNTQFTISVLYQLLNTRLMEKKPVILSTNLAPSELAARYTPQITSRLLGTYCLFQFYGDDIRFKLK
mgnify:CR=1 FL=1